jgi:predicted transposase YbfD/YdcC
LHLLSALTQGSLQFLGQGPVDHKTNEIRAVRPWLDPLDLAGRAVPLAALHPQPATARYLVFERDADYLFTLKDNQKQFKTPRCPPAARFFFPPQHTEPVSGAHGRIEWRDSALPPVSAGDFGFVAAAQVARVRRHRLSKKTGRIQTQTAYLVTSLWPTEATPAEVLAGHRAHWGIENGNHYRRAVTFDEDHCRIRHPGRAPVMATWRSLATKRLNECTGVSSASRCTRQSCAALNDERGPRSGRAFHRSLMNWSGTYGSSNASKSEVPVSGSEFMPLQATHLN